MSALDAGFFFVEGENVPMHVGSVMVFEGPAPTYGDLVRLLAREAAAGAQIPAAGACRTARTSGCRSGSTTSTSRSSITCGTPPCRGRAGHEQLRNLAGRVFAQRLDRAKPLWEVWLVEGLEDGRWALISKVHHCMVDGVSGSDLMTVLFDLSPDAELPQPVVLDAAPRPTAAEVLADGLRDNLAEPFKLARGVLDGGSRSPRELLEFARGLPANARRLIAPAARSLNGPVGPHRRWAWCQADMAEVKRVRKAIGGTVNDVVLTAITRGFRDLLAARGELVDGLTVRSLVPVSVRAESERGTLNNRVSGVLVNLPVGEADPLERLSSLRAQMDDLKKTRQAVGAEVLTDLAGFAASTLLALGSRAAFRLPQPLVQTVTTNVPGPRFPLYVLGSAMLEAYPYVPIASNLRISIGIFSYLDRLYFGINADFDSVPDVDILSDGIRHGFDELAAAAVTAG